MFCKLARLLAFTALAGAAYMAYDSRDEIKRYMRIRQM